LSLRGWMQSSEQEQASTGGGAEARASSPMDENEQYPPIDAENEGEGPRSGAGAPSEPMSDAPSSDEGQDVSGNEASQTGQNNPNLTD